MKRVRFHADAALEVAHTAEWYETQRAGLGDDFLAELDAVLALLEAEDCVMSPVAEDARARRVFMPRFPHSVITIELGDDRFVLAVAHARRRPGYWLNRAR